jgi:tetratricopeptide (TPR) repeat protein
MWGTVPLVPAKINGAEVSLIADSGAFFSVLSQGAVAQFKLPILGTNPLAHATGIGGDQTISVANVKAFTIAGATLANVPFTVSDNELGPGVAGLMGQNVLGLDDVDYDLANGAIRLLHSSGCGNRNVVVWAADRETSIIPLETPIGRYKQTIGEAFVNGKRIRVLFDTGASTSILSLDAARRAGIDPGGAGVTRGGLQRGIGRRMLESWLAPVASFKIGDEEVRNTRLRLAAISLPNTDMLLGGDFFLSHRVYVANSQKRIYFTYNGGPVFNLAATPLGGGAPGEPAAETSAGKARGEPGAAGGDAKTEPAAADGFSRRGAAFAARREFASAIADLTRATTLAPTEAKYFTQRAIVYLQNGQPFLAMADLDRALKLKPDDTEALVTRAQLRVGGREMTAAVADLDAADRALPKEADIRLEMGHLYDRAEAAPAAIAQYSLWIKAHPDDNRLAGALNGRCWARALWNIDADKAVADCDAAIRRDRKVAQFYDSRGLAHLRLGENERAIEDYDAALALAPKIAWSLYGRGLARLRKGQAADGKADLAAAAVMAPKLPDYAKAHGFGP